MAELRILDEAAQEVDAAAAYLEEERAGYGLLFIDAYQQKLAQISRFPRSGPLLRDAPPGYMHHSRKPGYWRERLR